MRSKHRPLKFELGTIFASATLLFISGCSDSGQASKIQLKLEAIEKQQAQLLERILAIETSQKSNSDQISAMRYKFVTNEIEVLGNLTAESAKITRTAETSHLAVNSGKGRSVEISPSAIEISTGEDTNFARLDASSLRLSDRPGTYSLTSGNGILLSIGSKDSPYRSERENKLQLWSESTGQSAQILRDLWEEAPLRTSSSFFITESLDQPARFITAKDGGIGSFVVKLLAITNDGVVRLKVTNALAIEVADIRGALEWQGKPTTRGISNFVIEEAIAPSNSKIITVNLGAPKSKMVFITVSNIQVKGAIIR
jgi:hypothetical protein